MVSSRGRRIPCPQCKRNVEIFEWTDSPFDNCHCRRCKQTWVLRCCPNNECPHNEHPRQIDFLPLEQSGSTVRCKGCHKFHEWDEWEPLKAEDSYLLDRKPDALVEDPDLLTQAEQALEAPLVEEDPDLPTQAEQRLEEQRTDLSASDSRNASPQVVDPVTTGNSMNNDASDAPVKFLAANAGLFLALALLGLLPLFTAGALGFSFSVDAFEPEEEGQTFWLTVVPVGWVVVAISVVAFAVIAMTLMKSSRSAKRIENQVLAGLGLIASALLVASWYFANKQIDDGQREASSQLVDEGNLFAGIPGLGVSFGPALGFWLMLLASLAIVGVNIYLIVERAKPTKPARVIPDSSLADGIRELSGLRDQGMISEEEFTLAKRKLFGE
jgi:hypothetical protein